MITERDYRNEHVQTTAPDRLSRVRGCLLGGACGDALGAPVEFMEIHEIQGKYGILFPARRSFRI
jgi:ADP-ribosylglycohydrolase